MNAQRVNAHERKGVAKMRRTGRNEGNADVEPRRHQPRSWAELTSVIHGGLALLDDRWRLVFATERFAASLGTDFERIIGRHVQEVFPEFGGSDDTALQADIDRDSWQFDRHHDAGSGGIWIRIRIVAIDSLGPEVRAIVHVQDRSETARVLAERRDAVLRLTAVEFEERRRVSREIHDEAIQLLAALTLRFGTVPASPAVDELRMSLAAVTNDLRTAITEFDRDDEHTSAGELLRRWIGPHLTGAAIELTVRDHLGAAPSQSTVQAMFVFLYELVRAARTVGRRRTLDVAISAEHDGYRMLMLLSSSSWLDDTSGTVAAQVAAIVSYARSLGGTLSSTRDDDGMRTISIFLPEAERAHLERSSRPPTGGPACGRTHDPSDPQLKPSESAQRREPPPLDDTNWQDVLDALPESMVENDRDLRYLAVNRAWESLVEQSRTGVVGAPFSDVVEPRTADELATALQLVRTGDALTFDFRRSRESDEDLHLRVCAVPRLVDGAFDGLLVAQDDRTELRQLDKLHASAMADFSFARRHVTSRATGRLSKPLDDLQSVVDRVSADFGDDPDHPAIAEINRLLGEALPRARRSIELYEMPDLQHRDLAHGIRTSLGPILDGVEITFRTDSASSLSAQQLEVFFRIGREAVINSVKHGRASNVDLALTRNGDGVLLDVVDNGVGASPDQLAAAGDGHLGLRSMRDRAADRGGRFRIDSAPGGGTHVQVWLPT